MTDHIGSGSKILKMDINKYKKYLYKETKDVEEKGSYGSRVVKRIIHNVKASLYQIANIIKHREWLSKNQIVLNKINNKLNKAVALLQTPLKPENLNQINTIVSDIKKIYLTKEKPRKSIVKNEQKIQKIEEIENKIQEIQEKINTITTNATNLDKTFDQTNNISQNFKIATGEINKEESKETKNETIEETKNELPVITKNEDTFKVQEDKHTLNLTETKIEVLNEKPNPGIKGRCWNLVQKIKPYALPIICSLGVIALIVAGASLLSNTKSTEVTKITEDTKIVKKIVEDKNNIYIRLTDYTKEHLEHEEKTNKLIASMNLPPQLLSRYFQPQSTDNTNKTTITSDQMKFHPITFGESLTELERKTEIEIDKIVQFNKQKILNVISIIEDADFDLKLQGKLEGVNFFPSHNWIFTIDGIDGVIFKMTSPSREDISSEARFKNSEIVRDFIKKHNLNYLILPHTNRYDKFHGRIGITVEEMIPVEQNFNIQTDYYRQLGMQTPTPPKFQEMIRQLSFLIKELGLWDIKATNIPICPHGIALVDVDHLEEPCIGLSQLVSYVPSNLYDQLNNNDIECVPRVEDSKKKALDQIKDYNAMQKYFKNKNIKYGDEPIQMNQECREAIQNLGDQAMKIADKFLEYLNTQFKENPSHHALLQNRRLVSCSSSPSSPFYKHFKNMSLGVHFQIWQQIIELLQKHQVIYKFESTNALPSFIIG